LPAGGVNSQPRRPHAFSAPPRWRRKKQVGQNLEPGAQRCTIVAAIVYCDGTVQRSVAMKVKIAPLASRLLGDVNLYSKAHFPPT
jgi:hypothetical protein